MPSLHLVGVGKVGRAVLVQLGRDPAALRLVACSDRSGTVWDAGGLDPEALRAKKACGVPMAEQPGGLAASALDTDGEIRADVVLDVTPSEPAALGTTVANGDAVRERGARFVVAGKRAPAAAADRWFGGDNPVGIHAALGGTGQQLLRQLPEWRKRWRRVEVVGNATSSALLDALADGAAFPAAYELCASEGLLEADPTSDLDGSDAALKLGLVVGVLTGCPVDLGSVRRLDLRHLDARTVQALAASGAVPRVVAVAERDRPDALRLELRALSPDDPLAVPRKQVAYRYELVDGSAQVVHGSGIGPAATAAAALQDIPWLLGR